MKYLFLLSVLLLSACVSYGNKIDSAYASTIKEGVTTEAEVIERLGPPMSTARSSNGTKTLTYMHVKSQAKASSFIPIVGAFVGGADSQTQMLTINIVDGVVKDWSMTEGSSETNTGVTAI